MTKNILIANKSAGLIGVNLKVMHRLELSLDISYIEIHGEAHDQNSTILPEHQTGLESMQVQQFEQPCDILGNSDQGLFTVLEGSLNLTPETSVACDVRC